jgi:hypothetical protein
MKRHRSIPFQRGRSGRKQSHHEKEMVMDVATRRQTTRQPTVHPTNHTTLAPGCWYPAAGTPADGTPAVGERAALPDNGRDGAGEVQPSRNADGHGRTTLAGAGDRGAWRWRSSGWRWRSIAAPTRSPVTAPSVLRRCEQRCRPGASGHAALCVADDEAGGRCVGRRWRERSRRAN